MPMNSNSILLVGTWVLTQPISILIDLTRLVNYIKIIFLQDKCPLGQLSCKLIWFHKVFQRLVIDNQNEWATIKIISKWWNNANNYKALSFMYELYLTFVLLLDWLTYANTNSWPSSSCWVSIAPNLTMLQLVCNWDSRPWTSCLKLGIDESLTSNSWKASSCATSQMNSWSIYVN